MAYTLYPHVASQQQNCRFVQREAVPGTLQGGGKFSLGHFDSYTHIDPITAESWSPGISLCCTQHI